MLYCRRDCERLRPRTEEPMGYVASGENLLYMLPSLFGGEAEGKRTVYDLGNTSVLPSRSMVIHKGYDPSGS